MDKRADRGTGGTKKDTFCEISGACSRLRDVFDKGHYAVFLKSAVVNSCAELWSTKLIRASAKFRLNGRDSYVFLDGEATKFAINLRDQFINRKEPHTSQRFIVCSFFVLKTIIQLSDYLCLHAEIT